MPDLPEGSPTHPPARSPPSSLPPRPAQRSGSPSPQNAASALGSPAQVRVTFNTHTNTRRLLKTNTQQNTDNLPQTDVCAVPQHSLRLHTASLKERLIKVCTRLFYFAGLIRSWGHLVGSYSLCWTWS